MSAHHNLSRHIAGIALAASPQCAKQRYLIRWLGIAHILTCSRSTRSSICCRGSCIMHFKYTQHWCGLPSIDSYRGRPLNATPNELQPPSGELAIRWSNTPAMVLIIYCACGGHLRIEQIVQTLPRSDWSKFANVSHPSWWFIGSHLTDEENSFQVSSREFAAVKIC